MKTISTLSLFVLIYAFLLSCNSENPKPGPRNIMERNCMAKIIVLDDSLGRIRNHACEKIALSPTIKQYIASLHKLNDKNCPSDFNTAFDKHLDAWENILVVTDKYPDLRGEMTVLFKQLETGEHASEFIPLQKAIWDTWADIDVVLER